MNESLGTRTAILAAAGHLFARDGYDATSVRAITTLAHANLGAVTYHFGKKEYLYLEILRLKTRTMFDRIQAAAARPATSPERLTAIVRALIRHLSSDPEMPSLILHELALDRPIPLPLREHMRKMIALLTGTISEGQKDGAIVKGNPAFVAISVLAIPAYLALMRKPLQEVAGLDISEPPVRDELVDHIAEFIRRGLTPVTSERAASSTEEAGQS